MARRRPNRIAGLSRLLEQVPAEAVELIVATFQRHGEAQAAVALGGKATISPNGYGPYPLVVKVDKAKALKAGVSVTLYGSPAGFWSWLENGIDPHPVRPRKRATTSGRPPAMGGGLSHPIGGEVMRGMYPRQAWTRTVDAAEADLEGIVLQTLDDQLAEAA